MEYTLLGDVDGGPSLELDHERFAYAGKFVTERTGKAVAREDGSVVAAASVDRDRTDPATARVRYVTVREDRRGAGLGARMLSFLADRVLGDAERVLIAVNNAFAYEAAYKAGFGYTGERTGLSELVLSRPGDRTGETYRRGVAALAEREDLTGAEEAFLSARASAEPPETVEPTTDA